MDRMTPRIFSQFLESFSEFLTTYGYVIKRSNVFVFSAGLFTFDCYESLYFPGELFFKVDTRHSTLNIRFITKAASLKEACFAILDQAKKALD